MYYNFDLFDTQWTYSPVAIYQHDKVKEIAVGLSDPPYVLVRFKGTDW